MRDAFSMAFGQADDKRISSAMLPKSPGMSVERGAYTKARNYTGSKNGLAPAMW